MKYIVFLLLVFLTSCGEVNHKVSGSAKIEHSLDINICDKALSAKTKWECIDRVIKILETRCLVKGETNEI